MFTGTRLKACEVFFVFSQSWNSVRNNINSALPWHQAPHWQTISEFHMTILTTFPTEKQFIIWAMRAMSAIALQTYITRKHSSHFRPGIAELIFQLGKVKVNINKHK